MKQKFKKISIVGTLLLIALVISFAFFLKALFLEEESDKTVEKIDFSNGLSEHIQKDGIEYTLTFDKKTYSLDDTIRVNGKIESVSKYGLPYMTPDTCSYAHVDIAFSEDVHEFFLIGHQSEFSFFKRSGTTGAVQNCGQAFTHRTLEPDYSSSFSQTLKLKKPFKTKEFYETKDFYVLLDLKYFGEGIKMKIPLVFE